LCFLGTTIYYFSYVPVWDGWAYSQCYQSFAKTGTIICDGHIAIVPMVLFGLTQIFSPNNFQLAYLLNMLLGLLGKIFTGIRNTCRLFSRYLFYPVTNMENNVTLQELLSMFSLKESTVVENNGYCLTVLHLVAK
jgi:hypothetical protein